MDALKFEPEFQEAIWKTNAAILHLGQLEFDPKSFGDIDKEIGKFKD